ncbi:dicarboxylate/amino acid:cation symporter [Candidatus Sororendozoicomonas aggregata]|uniref:dicarboxylate/amino acid:cation symporter n=1 Tax=Candidatus Sororendozoicomonas aggregata TaxID=3073239 RepID=UPI002ED207BD
MVNNIAKRVLLALVAGLVIGGGIQAFAMPEGTIQSYIVNGVFHAGGSIFVSMIKLLVVPLIFVSIVNAVCSLEDISQFGRLGVKTFTLYLINTVIAISVAIGLAMLVQPGLGANLKVADGAFAVSRTGIPSLLNLVVNIVPTNPFQAFAEGNILQILFMAIITGIAIKKLENDETRSVSKGFSLANSVMMKLVTMVMSLAPYGVFFLTARLGATLNFSSVFSVLGYVTTTLSLMAFWLFFLYPLVIFAVTGIRPRAYLRKAREQMVFAVSTASSNATIPVTFKTLTEKLGVSEKVAGFSVPLGATMNMSGAATYMVVATMFVANAYGVAFNSTELITLAFTAFLLAIAAGGVPGSVAVTVGVLLHALGLPIEGLGIIVATDRIIDAVSTTTNVAGDIAVSTIVAKMEGEIKPLNKDAGSVTTGKIKYSRQCP